MNHAALKRSICKSLYLCTTHGGYYFKSLQKDVFYCLFVFITPSTCLIKNIFVKKALKGHLICVVGSDVNTHAPINLIEVPLAMTYIRIYFLKGLVGWCRTSTSLCTVYHVNAILLSFLLILH